MNPNRLVTWADDDRLDPGTQPYAVTIRMKTGALDPNIIQKGQDNQTGGYFKLAMKKGWPRCHFEDANRNTRAIGFVNDPRPETKISDGQWHTIRCEKTATGVRLTVNYGEPNAVSKFIRARSGRSTTTRRCSWAASSTATAPRSPATTTPARWTGSASSGPGSRGRP